MGNNEAIEMSSTENETEVESINLMNLNSFRDEGYLQEANRLFFHPLGLALVIMDGKDGVPITLEVWDFRHDPEGVYFGEGMIDADDIKTIEAERRALSKSRSHKLGFKVQQK